MTTQIFARLALTAATTLVATAVLTAQPQAAHAAIFTVGGTQYDITTVTGTFDNLSSTLTNPATAPWWGNSGLAKSFAEAVFAGLGTPNNDSLQQLLYGYSVQPRRTGPVFVYEEVHETFLAAQSRDLLLKGWGYMEGKGLVERPCCTVADEIYKGVYAVTLSGFISYERWAGVSGGSGSSYRSYTYATATPVPTPALLPGLVGIGIAAYRKRRLASSTPV
jgi:hypothetical protein